MTENLERQILEIIATDRIDIPISSMSSKLKRSKKKLAQDVNLSQYGNDFTGSRVYARIEEEDKQKARGMEQGIAQFSQNYPKYGRILQGIIEEKRTEREVHLYFGVNPGSRITQDDYLGVLTSMGYTQNAANNLYPVLIEASRSIKRAREEGERSILIG